MSPDGRGGATLRPLRERSCSKRQQESDHIAKGPTENQIYAAADTVGVRIYNFRPVKGGGYGFTLKTGERTKQRIDWRGKLVSSPRYQRLSQHERTSYAKGHEGERFRVVVPGAVCWHGHRDFFRELFAMAPDAIIKTAFITYKGAEHFERSYRATWDGPPESAQGSFAGYAKPYADACTCTGPDAGGY